MTNTAIKICLMSYPGSSGCLIDSFHHLRLNPRIASQVESTSYLLPSFPHATIIALILHYKCHLRTWEVPTLCFNLSYTTTRLVYFFFSFKDGWCICETLVPHLKIKPVYTKEGWFIIPSIINPNTYLF